MGEGSSCDRINVLENFFDAASYLPTYHTVIYEWARPGIIRQISHLESGRISSEGIEAFMEQYYLQGDGFGGLLDEWSEPLRSSFAAIQVQSSYSLPIRVDGQWWGILCFDYCQSAVRVSPAEIAVLRTIADCIGSAIQRDRTQKAILKAEQSRSQELATINTELQQTLDRLSESEERYRTLFEISSEGIFRVEYDPPIPLHLTIEEQIDLYYHNMYVAEGNATFAEMYGFDNPKSIIGMRISDVAISTSEQNQSFMRTLVENGYQLRNAETEEIDRYGNPRYFLNNITTVIKDGCAIGGWASQLDITELRLAQHALLEAEQRRVAELAKTNAALKQSLDTLASDPDIEAFLAQLLKTIAIQLHAPIVEYWYHAPQQKAYLGAIHWQQQTYTRSQILDRLPTHPGVAGCRVFPTLLDSKSLGPRSRPLYIPNLATSELAEAVTWHIQEGVGQLLNLPMTLGDETIGAIALYLSPDQTYSTEDQELAQALTHQATLAVQLTRLAEEARQAALFEERNRLAGEIHDTLAQTFTGISVQLELVNYLIPQETPEVSSILDRIATLAQTGLSEARRSVWSIYPAGEDYADLAQKLTDCAKQLTHSTMLQTQVNISGEPYPLSSFLGTNLFRIGQESIANVLKHAQATELSIELTYVPSQINLCIKDNGCGFTPQIQTEGFGLISISERTDRVGGQLRIITQPGQGTEIFVQVPL